MDERFCGECGASLTRGVTCAGCVSRVFTPEQVAIWIKAVGGGQ